MHKVRKSDLKALAKIARDLPVIMQHTLKKRLFEQDGKSMVESIPTEMAINHKRRMKKALREFGPAGVMAYLKAARSYVENSTKKEDLYGEKGKKLH